jgi:hypothetical protein
MYDVPRDENTFFQPVNYKEYFMKYIVSILLAFALLFSTSGLVFTNFTVVDAASAHTTIPTISIVSVVADKSVTIRTYNYPAHDHFKVLMNYMGTRGVNGKFVGSLDSGSGGSLTKTFNIPSYLKGQYQIAIRVQSTTGSGYFSYNWFYNNTSKSGTGGGLKHPKGYFGYPTMGIVSVTKNKDVTVKIYNLPKNDEFKVLMNKSGTKGINGVKVSTFDTGSGGNKTLKFSIPASLKGRSIIAIRVQSISGSGYFAYNWFYNTTH